METIGTSCYISNFNYVGFSPFSSTNSCSYHHNVHDENYDIKPFDQYPNPVYFYLSIILANVRQWSCIFIFGGIEKIGRRNEYRCTGIKHFENPLSPIILPSKGVILL